MIHAPVSIQSNLLWDIAGVDSLQTLKPLFGDVDRIAPFQSLEAELDQVPCSLLRLCEANFRLRWSGDAAHLRSLLTPITANKQVWVKQFPWLVSVQLPSNMSVERLAKMTIPSTGELLCIAKPPFSLSSLALHCAAPARLKTLSVLVWRHSICGSEAIELHTARQTVHRSG